MKEIGIATIQIIFIWMIPLLIIKFRNNKLTRWIGTIGMAYLLGIIFSLLIFIFDKVGIDIALNADIGEIVSHVAIGISIPLLLFSSNMRQTLRLSKNVLLSFLSVVISVILVTSIVFFIYSKNIQYGAELSGMAIGLYTGGTPNLNAIGNILGVDGQTISYANLSDMIIGAVFYMFLLILCKPMLKKFLKKRGNETYQKDELHVQNYDDISEKVNVMKDKYILLNILYAFLMALFGALIGLIIWLIFGAKEGKLIDNVVPMMMITVTIFGIIASFNPKVSNVKGNNLVGQYLILVFSFALASVIDFNDLSIHFLGIFTIFALITILSFLVHVFISKLLKTDVDCAIVTLTAGLYGPAFIPAITSQIKNDDLTAPGLICGSLGYAIGTFLGVGIGILLRLFL